MVEREIGLHENLHKIIGLLQTLVLLQIFTDFAKL